MSTKFLLSTPIDLHKAKMSEYFLENQPKSDKTSRLPLVLPQKSTPIHVEEAPIIRQNIPVSSIREVTPSKHIYQAP
jgi:hypothetical protein